MAKYEGVSKSVIQRLPRYRRYLKDLLNRGIHRISSGELAQLMKLTASQIRQDLNCFGGFGQQGYGYNVNYLYSKICSLLGVDAGIRAVVIGAGDLGRALVRSPMFEKRGVEILSLFDVDPKQIGREIAGITVRSMEALDDFCGALPVDMAVLTLPKDQAQEAASHLVKLGINGFWNFAGKDIEFPKEQDIIVENVHLGDSLMSLNYRLCQRKEALGKKTEG